MPPEKPTRIQVAINNTQTRIDECHKKIWLLQREVEILYEQKQMMEKLQSDQSLD
jgi:hypothetical protein